MKKKNIYKKSEAARGDGRRKMPTNPGNTVQRIWMRVDPIEMIL